MGRGLTPDDRRLWDRVARTVSQARSPKAARNIPGGARAPETAAETAPKPRPAAARPPRIGAPETPRPQAPRGHAVPAELEPRRQRRLARERDPIEATLDLHGLGRFQAQDQVTAFLSACQARGMRAVLLITGQGRRGDGVIRASVHEWLRAPALRAVVSGFASAHRRHGGDGAIYVTLKRRAPGAWP